ncbi:MAG: class II aldolase/adducin family protein [Clostridia bacterium]
MSTFSEKYVSTLEEYSRVSREAGSRRDFVQGGGGNTSVKLDDRLMAVKASGFCLGDVMPDHAYAVMNYADIRAFYRGHEATDFEDAEKNGSELAKASTILVEGIAPLRPSVEAGFHSLLGKFVIHSHSVYTNFACCAVEMHKILADVLKDADFWGVVPYIDPGARLSFAIRDELDRVERATGKIPTVLFMQNHGLIVHEETEDKCLALHSAVNTRFAEAFGVAADSFDTMNLEAYIADKLRARSYEGSFFIETPLYPDQMVFFNGTLSFGTAEPQSGEVLLDLSSGKIRSTAGEAQTRVVTETIAAVLFIQEQIEKKGYTLSTMGEKAKHFIANWESEKYRKSLLGAKA